VIYFALKYDHRIYRVATKNWHYFLYALTLSNIILS